jgi:hypothetical protein
VAQAAKLGRVHQLHRAEPAAPHVDARNDAVAQALVRHLHLVRRHAAGQDRGPALEDGDVLRACASVVHPRRLDCICYADKNQTEKTQVVRSLAHSSCTGRSDVSQSTVNDRKEGSRRPRRDENPRAPRQQARSEKVRGGRAPGVGPPDPPARGGVGARRVGMVE